MSREIVELTDETATDDDRTEATLLTMLAEGKPYAFIVASVEGEGEDEHLKLELGTNVPLNDIHILQFMLDGSAENLRKS